MSAIVESSTDAIISADCDGSITSWNGAAADLFHRDASEAIGQHLRTLIPAAQPEVIEGPIRRIGRGLGVEPFSTVARRRDATEFHASISLSPIASATGDLAGVSMIVRDESEVIARREQAEQDRRRLADAQASAGLGSFEVDLHTGAVSRPDELWRILGQPPGTESELLSSVHPDDVASARQALEAIVGGQTHATVTHRIVRTDGEIRWVVSQTRTSRDHPGVLSGTTLDITERHLAELALAHQAHHDPLTDLPNRRLFIDRLQASLERNMATGRQTAVLFIDLDDRCAHRRRAHPGRHRRPPRR